MFLPLHPSRSSFTLQYHTRSVSPISLRLCLSVSTSPLGSERPMYPHERERWESLKYWWPQARATSGTLCRGYRPGPQSHWVRVAELQWRGQVCHGRWKRGGGKQMRRSDGVCMCACKNHVIPAASWLRHMRPVVCFRVILSFVQGRACTEWVDSWAWLCPSSFLRDQPEHKHEVGFELSACLCTPPPSLPFFSVAFFHRSWHPPPPKTHTQPNPSFSPPSHFLLVSHTPYLCLKIVSVSRSPVLLWVTSPLWWRWPCQREPWESPWRRHLARWCLQRGKGGKRGRGSKERE